MSRARQQLRLLTDQHPGAGYPDALTTRGVFSIAQSAWQDLMLPTVPERQRTLRRVDLQLRLAKALQRPRVETLMSGIEMTTPSRTFSACDVRVCCGLTHRTVAGSLGLRLIRHACRKAQRRYHHPTQDTAVRLCVGPAALGRLRRPQLPISSLVNAHRNVKRRPISRSDREGRLSCADR